MIRKRDTDHAFNLYQGSLLVNSDSPEIEQWRQCIDAVMGQSLDNCDNPEQIIQQCNPSAGELIRERLIELSSH